MSTPTHIVGRGNKHVAGVSNNGQLVTAPFAYDEAKFVELAEPNTGYNFQEPRDGYQFVLTGFYAKADKQVSTTTEALFVIYEADEPDTTTATKTVFSTVLLQYDQLNMSPINLLITEGKFLNAKTSDDDIHLTIFGYFIPTVI